MSDNEPEGPKYRVEHASTEQATCQQAACKRAGSKIAMGELRIGTHTLFDRDGESRWYMAWRHWACATKHQINGLKELAEDDPTRAPGYHRLSPESQEQLRAAMETGFITDKTFKDIRSDLAGGAPVSGGDIINAVGYRIDMPTRPAACRAPQCTEKVVKGELRVGFLKTFDEDHSSWVYKHWNCISKRDIAALQSSHGHDSADESDSVGGLEGLGELSTTAMEAILETFTTSELVQVDKVEPEVKSKKTSATKAKITQTTDTDMRDASEPKAAEQQNEPGMKSKKKSAIKSKDTQTAGSDKTQASESKADEQQDKPEVEKPKRVRKKRAAAPAEDLSDAEPEYVPRKTRSRRTAD